MLEVRVRGGWGTPEVDVDLRIGRDPLVLIGPNGAGKTTLFLLILGVLRPAAGRIVLDGEVLYDREQQLDLPPEGRGIAYLPQHYALFPHLDVLRNAAFGLRGARHRHLSTAEREARARAVLDQLEVGHLAHRHPDELSGGERQRVALARALAIEPRALVLDEPVAALDVGLRRQVRSFLGNYLSALKIPCIVITHDPADAAALGGNMAVMEKGRIVQRGALEELARRPATAFVEEFVSLRATPITP